MSQNVKIIVTVHTILVCPTATDRGVKATTGRLVNFLQQLTFFDRARVSKFLSLDTLIFVLHKISKFPSVICLKDMCFFALMRIVDIYTSVSVSGSISWLASTWAANAEAETLMIAHASIDVNAYLRTSLQLVRIVTCNSPAQSFMIFIILPFLAFPVSPQCVSLQ